MDNATMIDAPNMKISTRDDFMKGLGFRGNRKIEFLPNNVNENFPNLLGYRADACLIREISYPNFRGLNMLRRLDLDVNRIEKIASDTFSDLTSLQIVYLSEIFLI